MTTKTLLRLSLFAAGVAFALTSCREIKVTSTPDSAPTYYGHWIGPSVDLTLTPGRTLSSGGLVEVTVGAKIEYRRPYALSECEWKGLSGRDIVFECGDSAAELIRVGAAPHQEDGIWKMTVDQVEVTRQK